MDKLKSSKMFALSLQEKRDVTATLPWFVTKAKYPPRPGNVIEPLINGERAFEAVYKAINGAKKTVDIISWGFDPSMRLLRPDGERLGELLRRKTDMWKAENYKTIQIRILLWKNAIANFKENNIIGDGLLGSGGGTGMGSGVGGLESAGGGSGSQGEFNDYGGFTNSAAIQRDDDEAKRFNREWFDYLPPDLEFRTRDFSLSERREIELLQIIQRGLRSPTRTSALSLFASHHQKTILVDYESPEDAVGFVMGHNLLRAYWDTDAHEYFSSQRLGFQPWQDLSCRVRGPVLYDLNENFMTAWDKAEGLGSKFFWTDERKARKSEDFIAPAKRHGQGVMAQICRTQPQERERSIRAAYNLAITHARSYIYFENQYFRYREFADLLRAERRKLKAKGWPKDLYIFVVTNMPDNSGRGYTYEMLAALGQGHRMPEYHREKSERSAEDELRKSDLAGVNIHVATLWTSGIARGANAAAPKPVVRYAPIYIHSKLLLVDDLFFTLGSANVNVRSMEVDSELNISSPSPELTRYWREHLWKIHTRRDVTNDMRDEFRRWGTLMSENAIKMEKGEPLAASLIDFHDVSDKAPLDID